MFWGLIGGILGRMRECPSCVLDFGLEPIFLCREF